MLHMTSQGDSKNYKHPDSFEEDVFDSTFRLSHMQLQATPWPDGEEAFSQEAVQKAHNDMSTSIARPGSIHFEDTWQSEINPVMADDFFITEQSTWIIPVVYSPGKLANQRSETRATENYVSSIRNLVRSSGIYALSSIA